MSPPMKQPSLWEPSKLLKPYKYVIKSSFFQIDHGCLYMEDCSIGSNNQVLRKVIVCNKIFLLETLFNLQVFWSWRILLKVILIVTHFLLEVFWCELKKKLEKEKKSGNYLNVFPTSSSCKLSARPIWKWAAQWTQRNVL